MDRNYVDAIRTLFKAHGVTDYQFEFGGKHPRLVARHGDATVRVPFPSSGSDRRRGVANFCAYLRRELGLVRPPKAPIRACRRRRQSSGTASTASKAIALARTAAKPSWQETLALLIASQP